MPECRLHIRHLPAMQDVSGNFGRAAFIHDNRNSAATNTALAGLHFNVETSPFPSQQQSRGRQGEFEGYAHGSHNKIIRSSSHAVLALRAPAYALTMGRAVLTPLLSSYLNETLVSGNLPPRRILPFAWNLLHQIHPLLLLRQARVPVVVPEEVTGDTHSLTSQVRRRWIRSRSSCFRPVHTCSNRSCRTTHNPNQHFSSTPLACSDQCHR